VARRSEVTEEYYWLHHDPAGDLLVVASDSDQITSRQILANCEPAFDRWMRDQIEAIFGLDLGAALNPSNESLRGWCP
jgi:hypothetical protein